LSGFKKYFLFQITIKNVFFLLSLLFFFTTTLN